MKRFSILMSFVLMSWPYAFAQTSEPVKQQKVAPPRTEQSWIVESIVRDIVDMAWFAKTKNQPSLTAEAVSVEEQSSPDKPLYAATIRLPDRPEIKVMIPIAGMVWDPAVYTPVANAMFEALSILPVKNDMVIDSRPVSTLLNPKAEEIQRLNHAVSKWLNEHPLDPEGHEQASLVIGTLGLRENSGVFWDTRWFCNRAAAHLAFAKALRHNAPYSDSGDLGELIIGLLSDTKRDCKTRIEELKKRAEQSSDLRAWTTICELRNSRDWSFVMNRDSASLLERIGLFRAYGEAVSAGGASEILLARPPEPIPDWSRIMLQLPFGVGDGHVYTKNALSLEFRDIEIGRESCRARG